MNRTIYIIFTFIHLGLIGISQPGAKVSIYKDLYKGIIWSEGSWQEIKATAVKNNKHIFIDAYATWCLPCKQMDKDVYSDESVGIVVNSKFISVKMQVDTTFKDNEYVRQWHLYASDLTRECKIDVFPTYLFFSPEGKLVHKENGTLSKMDFIQLVTDVLDPTKQLYTLLSAYREGLRDYRIMDDQAHAARKIGDDSLARSISKNYYENYLLKLDDTLLFTKDNLNFIFKEFYFLTDNERSTGRIFNFFFHHPKTGDSLMWKGFSDIEVRRVILREEVLSDSFNAVKLLNKEPDWKAIINRIDKKYGTEYGESIVAGYQPKYYSKAGKWKEWVNFYEEKMNAIPPSARGKNYHFWGDSWGLNHLAWFAFKNCNDKQALKKVLRWSELSIHFSRFTPIVAEYMDTRANLLYKIGKQNEAIKQEEEAITISISNNGSAHAVYRKNLEKMKAGEPTWPVKKQ